MSKTLCPSEVARLVHPVQWRTHMQMVRDVGVRLWREGRLRVTQKGVDVDPTLVKGPIR